MSRGAAIALIGVALLVAGLLLGFSGVGNGCGSAFSPDYSQAQMADTLVGVDGREDACRQVVSDQKPWAFGSLGLGALAVILSFVTPTPARQPQD